MNTSDQEHHHESHDGRGSRACENERHVEAVIRAERNHLVRALSPYRVLRREALAREAGAAAWHQEGFRRALEAAVRAGDIEQLPFGFYRLPHSRRMDRTRPADDAA
jgi:hypothetical protein